MAPIDWNIVTGVSTGATALLLFLAFLFGDSILPRLRGQPRLTVHASRRASWNEPGAGPGLYVRLRNAGRRRITDANLRVWAVSEKASVASRPRMKKYGVRVVPTLIIDGKIKVEGRLNEPWVCGDDFYAMLERKYPLVNATLKRGPSTQSTRAPSNQPP